MQDLLDFCANSADVSPVQRYLAIENAKIMAVVSLRSIFASQRHPQPQIALLAHLWSLQRLSPIIRVQHFRYHLCQPLAFHSERARCCPIICVVRAVLRQ